MIHFIRTSRFSKIIASYLALQLVIMTVQPSQLFALTGGPAQPEFNSFTPIGTSDMVSLTSGDFNYNIPIMDVGGYPLNLAYNSGITMDQEASWVGLGWNLNVGQIARSVRGLPDDFDGDKLRYENDSRENVTLGINGNIPISIFGADSPLEANIGLGVSYNNLNGYTATPSLGVSYSISDNASVGLNLSSNIESGPTVSPSVNFSKTLGDKETNDVYTVKGGVGLGFNSRQGLQNLNLSTSVKRGALSNGFSGSISFDDQNYTPRIRTGLQTDSYTYNISGGGTVVGFQIQGQLTGYGTYQKIKDSERDKEVPAFGYEHTEGAHNVNQGGVLDVNRENEATVNKHTNLLSVPNYTYDMYAIQGQGIGGSFRPYRGQVGYLYDATVSNSSGSGTFGAEFGAGNLWYAGAEIKLTDVEAKSQQWKDKNFALPRFTENTDDDDSIHYERSYFKTYGSLDVDNDIDLYKQNALGETPVRLQIDGSKYERRLSPVFVPKENVEGADPTPITNKIKRTERHTRNQSIHSVTNETAQYDPQVLHRNEVLEGEEDAFAKAHHTVGMKVMKPDGSTYVYGESVYNTKKVETTFDVSKRRTTANCTDGTVTYNPNLLSNRSAHSDGFLNRVTTPAYAHTYLLSAVLSSDYEDLQGDGPTDDDLGAYTKFIYDTHNENYKWRVPFEENKASYNEGLKSNTRDEKANYIYGEKEIKYIKKIETKTHVAIFKLSDRNDGRGVKGEHGGAATTEDNVMQKLDKIYLFSKPEYRAFQVALENDDPDDDPSETDLMEATIKIAHFKYQDYTENGVYTPGLEGDELCMGVPNASGNGGKLTLEKVYFTYRGSYMGKHTPYTFHYADFDNDGEMEANPSYNMKGYDTWGCYKPNEANSCSVTAPLSTSEYPFVDQDKELADHYTRSWSLSSIDLPSGGKMEIQLEADDYQYVQQRKALEMFKVVGAGGQAGANGEAPDFFESSAIVNSEEITTQSLYDNDGHHKYLYVQLSDGALPDVPDGQAFRDSYLKGYEDEPIFFRFLLNMKKNTASLYDYVEGYFLIDQDRIGDINVFQHPDSDATYVALPMEFLDLEGISNNGQSVNPISKAGWYFGRKYLTRLVYGNEEEVNTDDFSAVIESIFDALGAVAELTESPNGVLEERGIAREFMANKSWIRLVNQNNHKLGGGSRVTSIHLYDQWDEMTGNSGNENYRQFYGQEYSYSNEDGTSSGVATFEPNSSKENPYVEPFYNKSSNSYKDKINAPRESNYVEKPIGAAFYPSPSVTYGRVTVSNLERINEEGLTLKKHATGKVVTEHYTSKDFPTISNFTALHAFADKPTALSQLFKFSVKHHRTMTQGFVVETNDMNGKVKRQEVFAEDKESPISGVTYRYSTQEGNANRLNNTLATIDDKGNVSEKLIGLDYEIINDFRESKTNTKTGGVNINTTGFQIAILPVVFPLPVPTLAKHETQLRTATTMKHIHKTGIMVEKTAYDLGSKVATRYLAWDGETGQVLLTKTINEYDDNYFNFTYPVHWYDDYEGMGRAAQNIDMEGVFTAGADGYFSLESLTNSDNLNAGTYLIEGDEVLLSSSDPAFTTDTYWVAGFNGNNLMLMNRQGEILNECGDEEGSYTFRVTRSGYRNQQGASMASVTSMINPIDIDNNGSTNHLNATSFEYAEGDAFNPRIINASAIAYKDFWLPQDEYRLARFYIDPDNGTIDNTVQHANPYLYNVKAEWRALKSYAYLTGRNFNTHPTVQGASPRNEGFFDEFQPFYQLTTTGGNWEIQDANWTFASEVSQYSPYGAELENMDALQRFSAAQYGYNYTLPTAVGSNTQYRELGFDGFEDYTYTARPLNPTGTVGGPINHHFSFADTPGVQRTQSRAHTGEYSVLVSGEGNSVTLTRSLEDIPIGPRELCPVDPPPPPDPICHSQNPLISACNQQQRVEIPLGEPLDFGAGYASITYTPLGANQFPDANIDVNQNTGQLFANLNIYGCAFSHPTMILHFSYELTDINDNTSASCEIYAEVSTNYEDCAVPQCGNSGQANCDCD